MTGYNKLITQLNEWHAQEEYVKIVNAIANVATSDINNELKGQLGRAFNNVSKYDTAIKVLEEVHQKDRDDIWNFRMGYAFFYKKDYRNSLESFSACHQYIEEKDEDTLYFIRECQKSMQYKPMSKKMILDVVEIINKYSVEDKNLDDDFFDELKNIGLSEHHFSEVSMDIGRAYQAIPFLGEGMSPSDFEENEIFDATLSYFIFVIEKDQIKPKSESDN